MSKIKVSLKAISFLYDFAVNGGAVATIPMGVSLPINSQVFAFSIVPVTDLVSSGNSVIFITADNDFFGGGIESQPYRYYNAYIYKTLDTNSFIQIYSTQINLTIETDTLTAGAFKFVIYYNEFD